MKIEETKIYQESEGDELAKQLMTMFKDHQLVEAFDFCYKLIKSEQEYIAQLETLVLKYTTAELKKVIKKMAPIIADALRDGIEMENIRELPSIKPQYELMNELQDTIELINKSKSNGNR